MGTEERTLTRAELVAEATARFGVDPYSWAFLCPNCGDVATAADFKAAGADPNQVGQECLGRHLGALSGPPTTDSGKSIATRGCDWSAYGLFSGPWTITLPNGNTASAFPLAQASPTPGADPDRRSPR
jgi:hypothetical protein